MNIRIKSFERFIATKREEESRLQESASEEISVVKNRRRGKARRLGRVVLTLWIGMMSLQADVRDVAGVKQYLVENVKKIHVAAADFSKNAETYSALIQKHQGDYSKANKASGKEIQKLVAAMKENYKAMDSFGYETVEGIVAGVESLAAYDVYLDAGVPYAEGAEDVSPCVLTLSDGSKIDRQGALFTYIIEPALWNGDARWGKAVDLNGDGKVEPSEALPKAEILTAAAQDAKVQIGKLLADSQAWEPTVKDCFGAMTTMTPTLSEYFEDWKESRYSEKASGRFNAVSRISDMRGIMKSCSVLFSAVHEPVRKKDAALAKSIDSGFRQIFLFLDKIDAREKSGKPIQPAEIDEMASQAKVKTDKLVPQIEQARALILKSS